jgi:hypothetical protein
MPYLYKYIFWVSILFLGTIRVPVLLFLEYNIQSIPTCFSIEDPTHVYQATEGRGREFSLSMVPKPRTKEALGRRGVSSAKCISKRTGPSNRCFDSVKRTEIREPYYHFLDLSDGLHWDLGNASRLAALRIRL